MGGWFYFDTFFCLGFSDYFRMSREVQAMEAWLYQYRDIQYRIENQMSAILIPFFPDKCWKKHFHCPLFPSCSFVGTWIDTKGNSLTRTTVVVMEKIQKFSPPFGTLRVKMVPISGRVHYLEFHPPSPPKVHWSCDCNNFVCSFRSVRSHSY